MNILYIHTHDSGRYLSPYGYSVPTPNLMRLAKEGTLFRRAFCTAPTCSPSRVGMLSGMIPHTSNMLGLAHRGFQMKDYSFHLANYLGRKGFETVLCGVQHEAPQTDMIGYHRILEVEKEKEYPCSSVEKDKKNAEKVANYIRLSDTNKPFFLSFGMQNTHRDYPPHQDFVDPGYVMPAFPLADTKENREDMADYMRSAQVVDQCVGTVLQALNESGRDKDTIVLFTTDHGIAMPFMKCNLYDTGIGVALIIKYPENPAAGKVCDALVSHLDVFPTLCELTGTEKPEWLQGVSMLPLFRDPDAEIRNEIFAEVNYHAAYEPLRCIRTNRYKLIRFYDYHNSHIPANIDGSFPKELLLQTEWLSMPRDREMLFDLWMDPIERVNLVKEQAYKEIYNELSQKLWDWMKRTRDPLLKYRYRVPAPENARINVLSSTSPNSQIFE